MRQSMREKMKALMKGGRYYKKGYYIFYWIVWTLFQILKHLYLFPISLIPFLIFSFSHSNSFIVNICSNSIYSLMCYSSSIFYFCFVNSLFRLLNLNPSSILLWNNNYTLLLITLCDSLPFKNQTQVSASQRLINIFEKTFKSCLIWKIFRENRC